MNHPLFEGAFTVYGDTYHVKLTDNYRLTKRSDDADLADNLAHMIIYRDSDTVLKETASDTHNSGECGFDRLTHISKRSYNPLTLDFNVNNNNNFAVRNSYRDIFNGNGGDNTGKTLTKRAPAGCPTSKRGIKNYINMYSVDNKDAKSQRCSALYGRSSRLYLC